MKINIYEDGKQVLKPINLHFSFNSEGSMNHPALWCVSETGKKICTLLYFHVGRGGMHPCDGVKKKLEDAGYNTNELQWDEQGAIRFKVPEDWAIKEKS